MPGKLFLLAAALAGLLAVASCQSPASTPRVDTAAPQTILVEYTPALRDLLPLLGDCARQQSTLGLAVRELPAPDLDQSEGELRLRWGAPASAPGYAAVLAEETLALVVHPSSPLSSLTQAQLRSIYNGSVRRWSDLPECAPCTGELVEKEIHAWAYTPGEDIQQIFETLLGQRVQASAAAQAPYPEAVRQAVAEDPLALGFLPARLMDDSLRVIEIGGAPEDSLTRPILALLPAEPRGILRQWLGCLQEKLKK